MRLLQLDQLTDFAVESVSPFFENLPETDHKDGKYRLRKYSLVELLMEPKMFKVLEAKSFTQSKEYNNFQGDVEREFVLPEHHNTFDELYGAVQNAKESALVTAVDAVTMKTLGLVTSRFGKGGSPAFQNLRESDG